MSERNPKSHLLKALGWSVSGLVSAFKKEIAFRQETLLFCVLTPTAFLLDCSGAERAMLIGSLFLIFIAELFNTAIEAAIDRIGPEHHPLSGRAKDLASAAVFITLINAAAVWLLILLD
jgi:diacylglycerol kinase (ATP)